jgi:hypothetical protein
MTLPKGMPILFFDTDKLSVGVNTFPTRSDYLQATNIEALGVLRNSSATTGTNYIYGDTYLNSTDKTVYFQGNISLSTAAKQYISKFIYPIGAIYMSISSTNPSSLFGGTWSLWGTGRVPVCINTSDSGFSTVEKTGGSKTHRHTWRIGLHWWYGAAAGEGNGNGTGAYNYSTGQYDGWARSLSSLSVNVNNANYNSKGSTSASSSGYYSIGDTDVASGLQPYITCYMWKRTA